jgi:hypothetical protein
MYRYFFLLWYKHRNNYMEMLILLGAELYSYTIDQSSMVDGFSSSDLKTAIQRAPIAPSTTLWSQLIVTDITLALRYLVVIVYVWHAQG